MKKAILGLAILFSFVSVLPAAVVTGNPNADGWSFEGNSLAKGTYVRGEGTFSFDIYSTSFQVTSGSSFDITDGGYSWLVGDTVLGLGGQFVPTTAAAAGWPSFQPNAYSGGGVAVNDDVSGSSRPVAKFGTESSNFTASTTAPFVNGDGNGAMNLGHGGDGSVLARITQNRGSTDSGLLHLLDRVEVYKGDGTVLTYGSLSTNTTFRKVARFIYIWDAINGNIASWEILLNVSLLERQVDYAVYPTANDQGIMAVQRSDNRYTDGLVQGAAAAVVPEQQSLAIWAILGLSAGAFVMLKSRGQRAAA